MYLGMYRDGGTIEYLFENIRYCIDNRIGSETKGQWYKRYPEKDNSNLIEDVELIRILNHELSLIK